MAFALHLRRDAKRQPRGLALLAVLLLHAGVAASFLLLRFEGVTARGAVAEPPAMVLVNIAPKALRQDVPALLEITPPAPSIPPLAAPEPIVFETEAPVPSAPAEKAAHAAEMQPAGMVLAPAPAPAGVPQSPVPHAATPAPSHAALEIYQKILWQQVASRRPPGIHLEGEAVVAFTLDRAGRLLFASIEQTSGNKLLDRLALRTVRTAAPFPSPPVELVPADLPNGVLRFSLAFNFS